MLSKNLTNSNLGTTTTLIYKDVNKQERKDVAKSVILTPQNKKKCSFTL
jgi:hypothetical protein